MIKHLKAFFTRQDMLDDWNKCVQSADEAKYNRLTMTKDGVQTVYIHYFPDKPGRMIERTYGESFTHIYSDIRIPQESQIFMFTRLRCPNNTKLTMELFTKEIQE